MRVSAKADYAVRAMIELAAADGSEDRPAKGESLAAAQGIPLRFLERILGELRVHGLVTSRRGSDGGYWLAKPPDQINVAEVIRAVEGPLATVHGEPADALEYNDQVMPLRDVWLALRSSIREVLETVTLADIASGSLPNAVTARASSSDASLPG